MGSLGKVRFSREPETGECNRYIGVHPFFFTAAYLDPHTKKALKKMMVTNQYQDLRGLILDMMVQIASKEKQNTKGDNDDHTLPVHHPPTGAAKSHLDFSFEGLYDSNDSESDDEEEEYDAVNQNSIQIRCEHQLASYDLLPFMKMKDSDGEYNNPLKLWKSIKSQMPELSQLAAEFLTITATSAPSERVWSRASRVISAKHARLNPEVTSRMIFAQEKVHLIRDHWQAHARPSLVGILSSYTF